MSGGVLEEFTYDSLDRLKTWVENGTSHTFSYDERGNLLDKDDLTLRYEHPLIGDRLTSAGATTYEYGATGNQTVREGDLVVGGRQEIGYTELNLPASVTLGYPGSQELLDYRYDAAGVRVQQHSSIEEQTVSHIGALFDRKRSDDGTLVVDSVHVVGDSGRRILTREFTSNGGVESEVDQYQYRDQLGSVRAVANQAGGIEEQRSFDPFGLETTGSLTDSVSAGFTGHRHDPTAGLVNMNGGIFDPAIGRFMSADPYVQAPHVSRTLNRYSYVWNNPTSAVDPSGFNCRGCGGGGSGPGAPGGGGGSGGSTAAGGGDGTGGADAFEQKLSQLTLFYAGFHVAAVEGIMASQGVGFNAAVLIAWAQAATVQNSGRGAPNNGQGSGTQSAAGGQSYSGIGGGVGFGQSGTAAASGSGAAGTAGGSAVDNSVPGPNYVPSYARGVKTVSGLIGQPALHNTVDFSSTHNVWNNIGAYGTAGLQVANLAMVGRSL